MWKEVIICLIIVALIVIGNNTTQSFSSDTIMEITSELNELKEVLKQDEMQTNNEHAKIKIDEIYELWKEKYKTLAYYIEHNELEKIETNLTGIKSYIESNEIPDAIEELDTASFILSHIEEKYAFNLQNIF